MSNTKTVMGQASNQYVAPTDITDVFSTYLYDGTSAEQTITNGIDLAGEGGMIWGKIRSSTDQHWLVDSERGTGSNNNYKYLMSNLSNGESDFASRSVSSFNSNGFTLQNGTDKQFNESGQDYASWTFRKAPKFFDVVTWTGDGVAGRTVSHNLGTTVGSIFIKELTQADYRWMVYHRSLGNGGLLNLATTGAASYNNSSFNNTDPTSDLFTLGSSAYVNGTGKEYVAYLFAHNDGDGGFGPDGDQDIIKCGSAPASAATDINLGFEPQWIMIKRTEADGDWQMFDTMRGLFAVSSPDDRRLKANTNDAEAGSGSSDYLYPTPTGFHINTNFFGGGPYIYMAIRRGPLAPPESATEVFAVDASPNSSFPVYEAGFPVDLGIRRYNYPSSGNSYFVGDRLRGGQRLITNLINAEANTTDVAFDSQDGWWTQPENSTSISWMWKRAPNFFDVVAYTGTNIAGLTINHNLGVVPEMIWVKNRSASEYWAVYHKDLNGGTNPSHYFLRLNTTDVETNYNEIWNDTEPTATQFTVGQQGVVNGSGKNHVAYLFASLPGISKVGSYTGDGTTGRVIDCGFTSGARFILIKRTDASGSWFVWDAERGIVSGNEPYLTLNQTAAEDSGSDTVDPNSSGFIVNETNYLNQNTSGGSYIFYAIA
jgi:hypothetical protein